MIDIRINIIDPNSINTYFDQPRSSPIHPPSQKKLTQSLHQGRIAQTNTLITQRIAASLIPRTASRLIRNTKDLESIPRDRIDQIRALDDDCLDGEGGGYEERERKDRELDLAENLLD